MSELRRAAKRASSVESLGRVKREHGVATLVPSGRKCGLRPSWIPTMTPFRTLAALGLAILAGSAHTSTPFASMRAGAVPSPATGVAQTSMRSSNTRPATRPDLKHTAPPEVDHLRKSDGQRLLALGDSLRQNAQWDAALQTYLAAARDNSDLTGAAIQGMRDVESARQSAALVQLGSAARELERHGFETEARQLRATLIGRTAVSDPSVWALWPLRPVSEALKLSVTGALAAGTLGIVLIGLLVTVRWILARIGKTRGRKRVAVHPFDRPETLVHLGFRDTVIAVHEKMKAQHALLKRTHIATTGRLPLVLHSSEKAPVSVMETLNPQSARVVRWLRDGFHKPQFEINGSTEKVGRHVKISAWAENRGKRLLTRRKYLLLENWLACEDEQAFELLVMVSKVNNEHSR